jgi:DNA helicase-2/ATP-dependent DNA helicase PcrA
MLASQDSNSWLQKLNPQQREAVTTIQGPLLISAGAGSGKTRVITQRIAYLIEQHRVAPWHILAITFTNKAAREMQARVEQLVGSAARDIWVSTFHAMCVRMLRRDIDRIGYSSNFSILDSDDQLSVIKGCLKERNLDPKKYDPRALQNRFSDAKNNLRSTEQMLATAKTPYDKMVAELFQSYQKRLKINNSLDFDDLMVVTIELFRKFPEILERYQQQFQYIHVDEYQDTNQAQYMLCHFLAKKHQNICVVGDSDQSIYSWRGADIRNILDFERDYPAAKVIKLEQNYRSTNQILQAANQVIQNNTGRIAKHLWSDKPDGEKIKIYGATTGNDEAFFIINKIRHNLTLGRKYNEHVVLYRTNAQSRGLEDIFKMSNIPYQIVGGVKFYDRKEIKDMIAYLRLIANPTDDISLLRILNVPKRGIGATTEDKLTRFAAERGCSLMDLLADSEHLDLPARTLKALREFYDMMMQLSYMQPYLSAHELTEKMLEMSRLRDEYIQEGSLEAQSRLENIDEFLTATLEFEKRNEDEDRSLVAFLTDLALIADIDTLNESNQEDSEQAKEQVTFMTLHSAKGLEFPVVFLIGMEEGIFPHSRSIADPEQMEEERRLCYVGITRAEEELYLTFAQMRNLYGSTMMNPISRFLKEIPENCAQLLQFQGVDRQSLQTPRTSSGLAPQNSSKSGPVKTSSQRATYPATNLPSNPPQTKEKNFAAGDKVQHTKWGVGTVIAVKGSGQDMQLQIAFPAPVGIKLLLAEFAPIKKI